MQRERELGTLRRRPRPSSVRGPVSSVLGLPASTIGAVLCRWAMPHLIDLDRITGELLRSRVTDNRYEHGRSGDLLHIDVKTLGRIPEGGGWRRIGANTPDHHYGKRRNTGFDFINVAVDDHSRVAYAEIHPDEKVETCAGFLCRAITWFSDRHGVLVYRILIDIQAWWRPEGPPIVRPAV